MLSGKRNKSPSIEPPKSPKNTTQQSCQTSERKKETYGSAKLKYSNTENCMANLNFCIEKERTPEFLEIISPLDQRTLPCAVFTSYKSHKNNILYRRISESSTHCHN